MRPQLVKTAWLQADVSIPTRGDLKSIQELCAEPYLSKALQRARNLSRSSQAWEYKGEASPVQCISLRISPFELANDAQKKLGNDRYAQIVVKFDTLQVCLDESAGVVARDGWLMSNLFSEFGPSEPIIE